MVDTQQTPALAMLADTITEYRGRLDIDAGSKILLMDPVVAKFVSDLTKDIATPYGPKFIIATADVNASPSSVDGDPNVTTEPLTGLEKRMDYFTHAIVDVTDADGKVAMEIMKWAKYALQPKGICVAVALQKDSKGQNFGEKMMAQSKQRVKSLADVFEFAQFEIGKIKSLERTVEYKGEKVEAEVVLGMKWDQLTA